MKIDLGLIVFLLWYLDGIFFADSSNSTDMNDFEAEANTTAKVLSRRRRYIVFPKGSSLQLLLELLTHVPTGVEIVLGPTMQIAWPLPSEPLKKSVSTTSRSLNQLDNNNLLENHVSHFKKFLGFERRKSSEKLPASRKYKLFSSLGALLNVFGMTVGLAWQLPDDPMIYSDFKKKHKIYKRNVFKKLEAFMRPGGADGKHCVLRALCESGQRTPSKKNFVQEILHKVFSFSSVLFLVYKMIWMKTERKQMKTKFIKLLTERGLHLVLRCIRNVGFLYSAFMMSPKHLTYKPANVLQNI